MNHHDITIIIVSKGLTALLNQCLLNLDAALRTYPANCRKTIVIVDNGSAIPYRHHMFLTTGIELLRFDREHSFSSANNRAARRFPSRYYLLLNNDVLLHKDAVTAMVHVLSSIPNAGICGTRLLFPDGTIQHCGVVFGSGKTGPYHCRYRQVEDLAPCSLEEYQAVTGACMVIRGDLWQALNGLSERYPFGLEDIDFCLRARQSGWRVFCDNSTASLHFESMTPGRIKKDVRSREIFMQHWQHRYSIDG